MSYFSWQEQQWQQLCNAYDKKTLPHALLINGQIGLGKFQFAKAFAKFLLCESNDKIKALAACDQCKQCNLINKESNPDLQIVTLEEDANVIKLEQIKNLIAYSNNTAQFNSFKIIIIYPAEKMNTAAANALLKNLEEPVGNLTLFMLVTHQLMALPATIRSRCHRLNFHVPQLSVVQQWLAAQAIDIYSADFESAYQLAQGAPLTCYQYLTDGTQIKLLQMVTELFNNSSWLISELSNKVSKFTVIDFIHCLQLAIINQIKVNIKVDKDKFYELFDEISELKKAVNSGIAVNAQLVIENSLIRIKKLGEINAN